MTDRPWREQMVSTSGGELLVREWGDESGQPVIFHHGSPSCGLDIPGGFAAPAETGVRLISYDRPGYGQSTRVPDRRVHDVEKWIEAITAALGVDRFATIGISGGGPYAMATAALMSDRVTALCIEVGFGPVELFDWEPGMPKESLDEMHAAQRSEADVRAKALEFTQGGANVDVWLDQQPARDKALGKTPEAIAERRVRDEIYPDVDIDGLVDDLRSLLAYPWNASPRDAHCPTLLAYGAADPFVPTSHGRAYQQFIPHATLQLIDNAGHDLRPEEPGFLRWLARW